MNIEYILKRIENKDDISLIKKAYIFLYETLLEVDHPNKNEVINNILEVTNILIDFNSDIKTIISSIIYETLNHGITKQIIEKRFDIEIANTSYKVFVLNNLELKYNSDIDDNSDIYDEDRYNDIPYIKYLKELDYDRKEDVSTLFIILAKRYYTIKLMDKESSEYIKDIANDTLNTLIPTAAKLRLGAIKSKTEDLCLYHLQPIAYDYILNNLEDTPENLEIYLNQMKENISKILIENNINFIIKSRVKSIYSIYNKLASGKEWNEIYDILAIRILVEKESDCQKIANLIHSKYQYLPSRLKDFISNPKENMYQSLHTTIIGEDKRFYEIQIRTHQMNKTAEIGPASHYLYKIKQLKKLIFKTK